MTDERNGVVPPTDERADAVPPKETQTQLMDAWGSAVIFTDVDPGSVEKALILGVNIRVKFPEAFVAAYETVEAGVEVAGAFAIHATWPMAVVKSYRAACSVFSTLVEKMTPLEYVTAVILSQHKEGIDEAALIAEVDRFLDNPETIKFGWHLGLTARLVEKASNDRYKGWLGDLLGDLEAKGFLTRNGTLLLPKQKNVEWKIGI